MIEVVKMMKEKMRLEATMEMRTQMTKTMKITTMMKTPIKLPNISKYGGNDETKSIQWEIMTLMIGWITKWMKAMPWTSMKRTSMPW